jgi:uncharacterized membrane protein SirB2
MQRTGINVTMRATTPEMNLRLVAFSLVFTPVYALLLYLRACTASIFPHYQPDIERFNWFSPQLVLILSFVIASFMARRPSEVVRFLQFSLAVCAIVFIFIIGCHAGSPAITQNPPAERTLGSTVSFALKHPQFSTRSYAVPFYNAVLAAVLWLVHRLRNRTMYRIARSSVPRKQQTAERKWE